MKINAFYQENLLFGNKMVSAGYVNLGGYLTHRSTFEDMIGEFEVWLKPESGVIKAVVEL
ncbi:hypothetical protein NST84_15560 [Paenibacillus sp. FSL R7-0345]|uniref:hypothetical protein n=1 Tax=Paenibacillus sp. FSL R7-0345 TaxID=2954535 RepID=UPI00315A9680